MSKLRPNWIWEQMQEVKREVDSWPQWMKESSCAKRQEPTEPTYPNHYDKDGYCDNPARGY